MKSLILFDEIAAFILLQPQRKSSFSVRRPIGRRTQSNRTADAIRSDGGRGIRSGGVRNPPLKINILTTDSVVSSLRTLNFCGFRAFRGRTIRTLNFWIPCVLWALLFPTEFTKFTEPLAMGISYKNRLRHRTVVAYFHYVTNSYFTPISLSRRSALPHLSMRKSM